MKTPVGLVCNISCLCIVSGFFFFYHKFFFLSNVVALENNMTLMLPRVALPDYRDAGEHRGLFFLFFLLKMTRF